MEKEGLKIQLGVEASTAILNRVLKKEEITDEFMIKLARNHPDLSFEQVLTAIKKALPNDYVPFMNTYAVNVKKLRHVQDAFEYAHLFSQTDTLKKLLHTHKRDDLLEEWTKVYEVFLSSSGTNLHLENCIIHLRGLNNIVYNEQLRMKIDISQLNYFDRIGGIKNITPLIDQFRTQFSKMESGFFKSALASRVTLLGGNASLFGAGDYESAESYYLAASVIESIPDALLATTYHGLGHIYIVQDKKRSLEAHEKAIFHAQKANHNDYVYKLKSNYFPFAKNMLGETFDLEGVVDHEQAHQYIVRGQNQKALDVIRSIEASGKLSAHAQFYKAKALSNIPLLFDTIRQFNAQGYTNMIMFVEKEIKKLI